MNKYKLNSSIFNQLKNSDYLYERMSNFLESKDFEERFVITNEFFEKIENIANKLEEEPFFKMMKLKIEEPEENIRRITKLLSICDYCGWVIDYKFIIWDDLKPHILDFCSCEKPVIKFNKDLFSENIDFLFFNWILKLKTWTNSLFQIRTDFENFSDPFYDEIRSRVNLNIRSKALFENICASTDSIKSNFYIFKFNHFLDESFISEDFFKENKYWKDLKNIQKDCKKFFNLIKELMEKNELKIWSQKEEDQIFNSFDFAFLTMEESEFIKKYRSKCLDYNFNIYNTYKPLNLDDEILSISNLFLVLFNNLSLFSFLIEAFHGKEN